MRHSAAMLLLTAGLLTGAPRFEWIYEQAPFLTCHASTVVETGPGELLAAWFGGSDEGKPDVAIWGAWRRNGKWSEPFEMVREPEIATYNPVLFFSRDNVLWLYWRLGPHPTRWTSARRFSRDRGRTWSAAEYLPAGLYGPIKNKPLVLSNGTVISGTSVESYRAWASWVERSTDHGKTWSKHGPVIYPGQPYGTIQPAIVTMRNGRLRMYVRTTASIGRIAYADSADQGVTWTPLAPTSLPNPNSGIDAVALRDGRIVMVYNHSARDRTPLRVAISTDGERWTTVADLETEAGEFSYPAVIQAADGALEITYTWNRKRIRHVSIPLAELARPGSAD